MRKGKDPEPAGSIPLTNRSGSPALIISVFQGHLPVRLERGQPRPGRDDGDPGRGRPPPALHQGGAQHLPDDHQVTTSVHFTSLYRFIALQLSSSSLLQRTLTLHIVHSNFSFRNRIRNYLIGSGSGPVIIWSVWIRIQTGNCCSDLDPDPDLSINKPKN